VNTLSTRETTHSGFEVDHQVFFSTDDLDEAVGYVVARLSS
jgi:hypothetical protein